MRQCCKFTSSIAKTYKTDSFIAKAYIKPPAYIHYTFTIYTYTLYQYYVYIYTLEMYIYIHTHTPAIYRYIWVCADILYICYKYPYTPIHAGAPEKGLTESGAWERYRLQSRPWESCRRDRIQIVFCFRDPWHHPPTML